MSLRRILVAAGFGWAIIVTGALPSRAQHVVTSADAGKLTLDALTAPPAPLYRPTYHRVLAVRRAHKPGYVSRQMHASSRRHRSHPRHSSRRRS